MNVLFITLAYPKEGRRNLYSDLMEEFIVHGHIVTVACQQEKRDGVKSDRVIQNGVSVLRIKTGNITKTGFIEKGISTLRIQSQFIQAIQKHVDIKCINLILYSTPPIAFTRSIAKLKKQSGAVTYLLLKDIFPQNAVDLGLISKNGILHRYFRKQEKTLYKVSDYIGCMSKANVEYILRHNLEIDPSRVEICPNSIRPSPSSIEPIETKASIREHLGFSFDTILLVYGGNIGRPQGIDFIIKTLSIFQQEECTSLLIIGSGTEYERMRIAVESVDCARIRIMNELPSEEFSEILKACDIGLIFLDARFTIPNFPSRLTAYLDNGIPVLAATDTNSDLKDAILEGNFGMWVESNNYESYKESVGFIVKNEGKRIEWSMKAKEYLNKNYTVNDSYNRIVRHS